VVELKLTTNLLDYSVLYRSYSSGA
jgi:hypothetical protein